MTEAQASAPVGESTTYSVDAKGMFKLEDGVAGLRGAISHIDQELTRGDGPLDFTPQGAAWLVQASTKITVELALEAIRLARSERLDSVSRAHVDRAMSRISRSDRNSQRVVPLSLGGVISGAGLQEFLNYAFADTVPPKVRVLVMIACLVVGASLLVYGFMPRKGIN